MSIAVTAGLTAAPLTDWEIHGMEFGNCNCSYGCPCQFNVGAQA
jgi:hypothetical protein